MDYKNIKSEYEKIIKTMNDNKNITVKDSSKEILDVTEEELLTINQMIEKKNNIKLNVDIKRCYIPNTIVLCWHYNIDGRIETGGEFKLEETYSSYTNPLKSDFADRLLPFEKELYQDGYRYFDAFPHAGSGTGVMLKIEKGTVYNKTYYVNPIYEDIMEIELDYPGYIKECFKLKGLYLWQYLFGHANLRGLRFDISFLKKSLEDYAILFPDFDVSEYLQRYKERGGR